MARTAKIILIVVLSAVVCAGLFVLSFRALVRTIYKQRTCEWANIDNIETHAKINIPDILDSDCLYNKERNTKMARFDIDTNEVDIQEYIRTNKLRKLRSANDIHLDHFLIKGNNINSSNLYYNNESYKGETWQALLDKSTARLWVTINYRD